MELGGKNQNKEHIMTVSQFYVDEMQKQNITLKTIKNKILNDFSEVGDLSIVVSECKTKQDEYKYLGYLLKHNPKSITHLKARWIALKLFWCMKFKKRISHVDGS